MEGKGDRVRPTDYKKYSTSYERIYGKKEDDKTKAATASRSGRNSPSGGSLGGSEG